MTAPSVVGQTMHNGASIRGVKIYQIVRKPILITDYGFRIFRDIHGMVEKKKFATNQINYQKH